MKKPETSVIHNTLKIYKIRKSLRCHAHEPDWNYPNRFIVGVWKLCTKFNLIFSVISEEPWWMSELAIFGILGILMMLYCLKIYVYGMKKEG